MKRGLLWCALSSAILALPAEGRKTFIFDASEAWHDSGFDYVAGSTVFIYATGAHADNPATDNFIHDPGGANRIVTINHPLLGVPENSLIMRAGVNGAITYVGTGGEFSLQDGGRLHFQLNDSALDNNVGSILVHIMDSPTTNVLVPVDQDWFDTGYDYSSGETVFFLPIGFHADNPATNNWIHTLAGSASGGIVAPGQPLVGVPDNSLIGRIGTQGAPFFIGTGGPIAQPDAGRLFVMPNDGATSNNVGHVLLYLFAENSGVAAAYCTAKTTSMGCIPFIGFSGVPSMSSTAPFFITAHDAVPNQIGVLLYGSQRTNFGFHGGKLCVKSPRRTSGKAAAGSADLACSGFPHVGRLTNNFNNRIQAGVDPLLTTGQAIYAQWLQRDPGNTIGGFGDNLSNAIEFTVLP